MQKKQTSAKLRVGRGHESRTREGMVNVVLADGSIAFLTANEPEPEKLSSISLAQLRHSERSNAVWRTTNPNAFSLASFSLCMRSQIRRMKTYKNGKRKI